MSQVILNLTAITSPPAGDGSAATSAKTVASPTDADFTRIAQAAQRVALGLLSKPRDPARSPADRHSAAALPSNVASRSESPNALRTVKPKLSSDPLALLDAAALLEAKTVAVNPAIPPADVATEFGSPDSLGSTGGTVALDVPVTASTNAGETPAVGILPAASTSTTGGAALGSALAAKQAALEASIAQLLKSPTLAAVSPAASHVPLEASSARGVDSNSSAAEHTASLAAALAAALAAHDVSRAAHGTTTTEPVAAPSKSAATPAQMAATAQTTATNVQTTATDPLESQSVIETKIKTMMQSGASDADVVAALASQLSRAVAQKLDVSEAAASGKLQAVFANALAPPGDAASSGDRSRILAQRFVRLESAASAIAGQQSGQHNRNAGSILDAHGAKDIPAPTPPTDSRSTLKPSPSGSIAVGQSDASLPPAAVTSRLASAVSPASAESAEIADQTPSVPSISTLAIGTSLPMASAVVGDGRTVDLKAKFAITSGGDTTLGRVLTRAALAADARETPAAQTPDSSAFVDPSDSDASSDASSGSSTDTSSDTVIAAFVKSLAATLKGDAVPDLRLPAIRNAQATALPSPVHATAEAPVAYTPPVVAPNVVVAATPAAAPAPAASDPPVDQSSIADQVLRGAFMRNVGQSSEIRLSLVPDSLGDVSVKLIVNSTGVSAHVLAENSGVRDALVAAQPQLTRSLADAGLKLTSFTVDLSNSGFAGFAQHQNDQSRNGNRPRATTNSVDSTEAIDETLLEAIPSFGPSKPSLPSSTNYNYLA